ncbi:MAG TPA: hypothetical protein VFD07_15030 [Candidatus Krumholzibacteria bacterium]|nr:hypothetical protein [Candidatus Krumholzibacteria bacterium]
MQRLLLIGLALVAGLAPVSRAVVPGEVAPEFTLQDRSGAWFTLSQLSGKAVLLALVGYG